MENSPAGNAHSHEAASLLTATVVDFMLYRDVSFQGVQTQALVKANSKTVILPVRNAMSDGFSSTLTCPDTEGDFERTRVSPSVPFPAISIRSHS